MIWYLGNAHSQYIKSKNKNKEKANKEVIMGNKKYLKVIAIVMAV